MFTPGGKVFKDCEKVTGTFKSLPFIDCSVALFHSTQRTFWRLYVWEPLFCWILSMKQLNFQLNWTSLILIQLTLLSFVKQNVNGNTWWRKGLKNWLVEPVHWNKLLKRTRSWKWIRLPRTNVWHLPEGWAYWLHIDPVLWWLVMDTGRVCLSWPSSQMPSPYQQNIHIQKQNDWQHNLFDCRFTL